MKQPKNSTLALCWLGLVGAGAGLVIWPGVSSARSLASEREELAGRLGRDEDGAAALRRLEEELIETRTRVQAEVTPVPVDSNVAGLIRDLSTLLTDRGVLEREITTGTPTDVEDVRALPMSVSLKTDFLNLYEVVRWVEELPRLVRAQRLHVEQERVRTGGESGRLEADLLLYVYFGGQGAAALEEEGG
ncbi:MAG: type 4a pilus biogenesis protein PilO [Planctomycetota bacterium]|nr:type 4a pilus biogenesis protein PilO [Planctomycetota bacterium]